MEIEIKRIYEQSSENDGFRILVDRLWPRGVSKEKANLDLWLKEIAPSPGLREWFGHEPGKFKEFGKKYTAELKRNKQAVGEFIAKTKGQKKVSLLYGAKDPEINHAAVLKKFLEKSK